MKHLVINYRDGFAQKLLIIIVFDDLVMVRWLENSVPIKA